MTPELRAKLLAMAARGTEHEAAIARTKLAEMGEEPPRQPPTRNGTASFGPSDWFLRNQATGTFTSSSTTASSIAVSW